MLAISKIKSRRKRSYVTSVVTSDRRIWLTQNFSVNITKKKSKIKLKIKKCSNILDSNVWTARWRKRCGYYYMDRDFFRICNPFNYHNTWSHFYLVRYFWLTFFIHNHTKLILNIKAIQICFCQSFLSRYFLIKTSRRYVFILFKPDLLNIVKYFWGNDYL